LCTHVHNRVDEREVRERLEVAEVTAGPGVYLPA